MLKGADLTYHATEQIKRGEGVAPGKSENGQKYQKAIFPFKKVPVVNITDLAKNLFLSVYQKNPTTNQWMDSTEHVQIKFIENELMISTKVLSTSMVLGRFPNE